jgi:hypothetical protein
MTPKELEFEAALLFELRVCKELWFNLRKQLEDEVALNRRIGHDDTDYRYHDALESVLVMMDQLEEK